MFANYNSIYFGEIKCQNSNHFAKRGIGIVNNDW